MIDYGYASLFRKNSVDKQLLIEYDGGTITNNELHQENFELTESICSGSELRFGCCEASEVKFRVSNILSMKNKEIKIKTVLDGNTGNPFQYGVYKVESDVLTADRRFRDIVAYDKMYEIINTNVADWYNSLKFPMNLNTFRNMFLMHFGLKWNIEDGTLVNDDMNIEKTIEPSELSGKDVIEAICELNGCFGKIGRSGNFEYVFLQGEIQGLYPDNDLYPSDDLLPRDPISTEIKNNIYISCTYEDFVTRKINKLQIRQSENDVGSIVGTGDNCYIVQNNFLVYGKDADELNVIAERLFKKIKDIEYRPFDAKTLGNPCLETGDAIRLMTKYELIESYILKRTIKGIQSLRDFISSSGVYEYSEKVNSVNSSIIQLKGKTNELERNVEETKSTITDVGKGLQSQITQNAEKIQSEVTRAMGAEGNLSSRVSQTASEIQSEVTRAIGAEEELSSNITQNAEMISSEVKRATKTEESLSSRITQTAESITSEVSKTYETKDNANSQYQKLSSSITQTAEKIQSEVERATLAEGSLSSRITQTADEISSKVSKDNIISEINQSAEAVSIKANKISLEGVTTVNDNFRIDETGKMHCEEADIKGNVSANTFTCWDTLKMGSSQYAQVATVLSVNVNNITGEVVVIIDPGGVVNEAVANAVLRCDKGLVTKSISHSESNILFRNSMLLAGFYGESFRPNSEYKDIGKLGTASLYWNAIYSKNGAVSVSDKNAKENIEYMDDKETFFNSLKPCTFKFKNGDRTHFGFISQDVEEALKENGMTAFDFAGFCKDLKMETFINDDGEEEERIVLDDMGEEQYTYSLRYSEFIALNTHMIQKANKKIEQQQKEIDDLKGTVSFLMEKLERLGV